MLIVHLFLLLHALSFLMKGCEKLLKVFHSKRGKNERGHDKSLHKVKEGYSKLFHLKLSIAFSNREKERESEKVQKRS